MLEVKPIQSKEIQKDLCGKCNVAFDCDSFAYSAYEKDDLIGISQFTIDGDTATVKNLAPAVGVDDFEAMFILGRGVLNFIDLCSVKTVIIEENAAEERIARAIGFKKADGKYLPLSLSGFFDSKCPSHK